MFKNSYRVKLHEEQITAFISLLGHEKPIIAFISLLGHEQPIGCANQLLPKHGYFLVKLQYAEGFILFVNDLFKEKSYGLTHKRVL